jgi:hypothetical protein
MKINFIIKRILMESKATANRPKNHRPMNQSHCLVVFFMGAFSFEYVVAVAGVEDYQRQEYASADQQ